MQVHLQLSLVCGGGYMQLLLAEKPAECWLGQF